MEYYRAPRSIGTIIVECCFIDDYGLAFPARSALIMIKNCRPARKSLRRSKPEGSKAILQIYHGGRMVDPQLIGGAAGGAGAIAAPREARHAAGAGGEEVEGMIAKFGDGVRCAILAGFDGSKFAGAEHLSHSAVAIRRTPTSAMTSGAVAATTAPFPTGGAAILPQNGPPVTPTMPSSSAIAVSPEEMEVRESALTTPCICWKGWPPAVSILCTSRWARPCVRLSSIPAIRHRLIEKYCAMRSDTLAQVPVMGVGGW